MSSPVGEVYQTGMSEKVRVPQGLRPTFPGPAGMPIHLPLPFPAGSKQNGGNSGYNPELEIPEVGSPSHSSRDDGCCTNYTHVYEPNDGKHGPVPRGNISAEPTNPNLALQSSVGAGTTRIGYDGLSGQLVLFRITRVNEQKCIKFWHGYVVYQRDSTPEQWKAGRDAGFPKWPRKPKGK